MLVNITPNLTQTWWDDLVKPFEEANPNIDVKIQAPVTENVQTTVPQLLASGDVPDIIQSLSADGRPCRRSCSTSPPTTSSSTRPLAEQYTIDGKYYTAGVGQQLQTIVFYNKAAFKEAGITEVPTTFEEFESRPRQAEGCRLDARSRPVPTGSPTSPRSTSVFRPC